MIWTLKGRMKVMSIWHNLSQVTIWSSYVLLYKTAYKCLLVSEGTGSSNLELVWHLTLLGYQPIRHLLTEEEHWPPTYIFVDIQRHASDDCTLSSSNDANLSFLKKRKKKEYLMLIGDHLLSMWLLLMLLESCPWL